MYSHIVGKWSVIFPASKHSEACIKRPRLGQKKWSLNRGGLLIEVKMYM